MKIPLAQNGRPPKLGAPKVNLLGKSREKLIKTARKHFEQSYFLLNIVLDYHYLYIWSSDM